MKHLTLVLMSGLIAANASAQIVNGTFNNNLNGWTKAGNVTWHPDGHANLSNDPNQSSHLSQEFKCGEPGDDGECIVTFRYKTDLPDVPGQFGLMVSLGPPGGAGTTKKLANTGGAWNVGTITSAPCGMKFLDFENIAPRALIDDVKAECVPEPASLAALGLGFFAVGRRRRA